MASEKFNTELNVKCDSDDMGDMAVQFDDHTDGDGRRSSMHTGSN